MYDAKDYAEEHRKFLEENNPSVLRGQKDPNSYLSLVGEQAEDMFGHLMMQRMHQVRNLSHLEKVRELEAFRHQADEMVRYDLIYQPLPESSTAATPASQRLSDFERDERDTEKMLATLRRRQQERSSASQPPASTPTNALPKSSTVPTPVSRPLSDFEQDERDTEKMVATLKRVAERRRQQERSSASLPASSGAIYDQEKFPSAAALVMARAARRVAVKYGDFGLVKVAKELHQRADSALKKRQSVLKSPSVKSDIK
jgi:hypothetical protein